MDLASFFFICIHNYDVFDLKVLNCLLLSPLRSSQLEQTVWNETTMKQKMSPNAMTHTVQKDIMSVGSLKVRHQTTY